MALSNRGRGARSKAGGGKVKPIVMIGSFAGPYNRTFALRS